MYLSKNDMKALIEASGWYESECDGGEHSQTLYNLVKKFKKRLPILCWQCKKDAVWEITIMTLEKTEHVFEECELCEYYSERTAEVLRREKIVPRKTLH